MLNISVDPIAFTIGSLQIRWYGIIVAIAVVVMLVMMLREAKRLGIARQIYSIFFWGIIGGFVGARLAYVIYDWEYFVANPIEIIGSLGLAQNGMLVGIVAAALIYMGVTRMRFSGLLTIGDAVAVGAPLALAIARIGCTINGCCHGQPSPFDFFPLAVTYTARDSMSPVYWGVSLYPTQIYHIFWNLIVFAIVWRFRGKFKFAGGLAFFFFCIFAAGDFGLRFLRASETWLWEFRLAQVVDLAAIALFLPWLIVKIRHYKKKALVTEPVSEALLEQSRED